MRPNKLSRALVGILLVQAGFSVSGKSHLRNTQQTRALAGPPGDRVAEINSDSATCMAGAPESPDAAKELTFIQYYYKIESNHIITTDAIREVERYMFVVISTGIMWCTLPKQAAIPVGGGRKLSEFAESSKFLEFSDNHKRITLEEARRLSIISFNTGPGDTSLTSSIFSNGKDPCESSKAIDCVVVLGKMSILAHNTDDLSLIVASSLDATEDAMDKSLLVNIPGCDHSCDFTSVSWLGDTLSEVIAGIEGNGGGGDTGGEGGDGTGVVDGDGSGIGGDGGDGTGGDGGDGTGGDGGDGTGGDGGDGTGDGGDGTGGDGGDGTGDGGDGTGDGGGGTGGDGGDGTGGDGGDGTGGDGGDGTGGDGGDGTGGDGGDGTGGDGGDGTGGDGGDGTSDGGDGTGGDGGDGTGGDGGDGTGGDGGDGTGDGGDGTGGDGGDGTSDGGDETGGDGGDGTEGDGTGGDGGDGTEGDGTVGGGGDGGDGIEVGDGTEGSGGDDGSDGDRGVVPDSDDVDEVSGGDNIAEEDDDDGSVPVVLYAAIPMALLLLFALLLAKNKRRISVKAPSDLLDLDQDHIIVGTGDPPRSFHEGMYHYTRSGARYLSTCCPDCAETRRMGFFAESDLPTISEGRLYDPESPSHDSYSFDEVVSLGSSVESEEDISSQDPSAHRKRFLVEASTRNLGKKGSAVDVHQCTSATCRICSYRPRDVAFVSSPSTAMFASSAEGLGASTVV